MSSWESTYLHLNTVMAANNCNFHFHYWVSCKGFYLDNQNETQYNLSFPPYPVHKNNTITFIHWAIHPFLIRRVDSPAFTCHHLMIMLICYNHTHNFAGVDEPGEEVSLADISIENIPSTITQESPARRCPPQKIHTPEVILTPGKNTSLLWYFYSPYPQLYSFYFLVLVSARIVDDSVSQAQYVMYQLWVFPKSQSSVMS